MKLYSANRAITDRKIKVTDGLNSYWLDPGPSQKLINHSPDGFNWGYGGSGPAQLALAILLDYLVAENKEIALQFYQSFKTNFVAGFSISGFNLSGDVISLWLRSQEKRGN